MPRNWLLTCGVVFFAAFIVAAGGAAPRYNRIVFGALPLVLALVCSALSHISADATSVLVPGGALASAAGCSRVLRL